MAHITASEWVIAVSGTVASASTGGMTYVPLVLGGVAVVGLLRRSQTLKDLANDCPPVGLLAVYEDDEDRPQQRLLTGPASKRASKPSRKREGRLSAWFSDFRASLSEDQEVVEADGEVYDEVERPSKPSQSVAEPVEEVEELNNWLDEPAAAQEIERTDDGKVKNQRKIMREAAASLPVVYHLREMHPPKSRTSFPIGLSQDGEELWFDLRPSEKHHVNFVSLTGQPNAGKDTMFKSWFRTLCQRNTPEQVKFVFVDGKGPWYAPSLRKSPYMLFPFEDWDGETGPVMARMMKDLDKEMKRRYRIIVEEHECEDLEEYVEETGDQSMPYIVVVVTDVMGDLNGDVERLLSRLVAKGRACGIRVWVSMQNTVGESSKWRSLMTAYISGPVQGPQSDQVVMGLEGSLLTYRPSYMDTETKGVFCVRYGPREWLVKGAWIEKAEFKRWYRRVYADTSGQEPQATRELPTYRPETGFQAAPKAWDDPRLTREEQAELRMWHQGAYKQLFDQNGGKVLTEAQEAMLNKLMVAERDRMIERRTKANDLLAGMLGVRSTDRSVKDFDGEVQTEVQTKSEVQASALLATSAAVEVSSEAKFRPAENAKKVLLTVPEADKPKLGKALQVYAVNGQKVTPAIREGWGSTGGEYFSQRADWVRAAFEVLLERQRSRQ